MANISFAGTNEPTFFDFSYSDVSYQSTNASTAVQFTYLSNANHLISLLGAGFGYSGGVPVSGIVNEIRFDLGSDVDIDIEITGLNTNALDFIFSVGTLEEQTARFWNTALAGADIFDFTMADYSVSFYMSGDGGDYGLNPGIAMLTGQPDQFLSGPQYPTNVITIYGDVNGKNGGSLTGAADFITVGAANDLGARAQRAQAARLSTSTPSTKKAVATSTSRSLANRK